jgi:pimeloyl-ACP methyl ester carboxylesterase
LILPEPGGFAKLAGGRRLAFDDVGDVRGCPVVYLHGCPDSRLTRHPDDRLAAAAGVRLIAVDRPGYGASDPPADRTRLSVARDVVSLLDHLGVERAAVLAWSSGGQVALACAAAAPDRVHAVALAASTAPSVFDGSVADLVAEMLPYVVPQDLTVALAREHVLEGKSAAYLADLDRVPGLVDQLALGLQVAVSGGRSGVEFDLHNLLVAWDFDLASVLAPVTLWHGTADDVVTRDVAEGLVERLPRADLRVVDGATHLLPLTHWTALLESLAQRFDMEDDTCR